ncbi:hypothetical protein [Streptomyces phage phiScoe55]|nr:hypothetical protein [Streptomyces phage phiScoe55]
MKPPTMSLPKGKLLEAIDSGAVSVSHVEAYLYFVLVRASRLRTLGPTGPQPVLLACR